MYQGKCPILREKTNPKLKVTFIECSMNTRSWHQSNTYPCDSLIFILDRLHFYFSTYKTIRKKDPICVRKVIMFVWRKHSNTFHEPYSLRHWPPIQLLHSMINNKFVLHDIEGNTILTLDFIYHKLVYLWVQLEYFQTMYVHNNEYYHYVNKHAIHHLIYTK